MTYVVSRIRRHFTRESRGQLFTSLPLKFTGGGYTGGAKVLFDVASFIVNANHGIM
jgi:hypothetical protein